MLGLKNKKKIRFTQVFFKLFQLKVREILKILIFEITLDDAILLYNKKILCIL